MSNSDAQFDTKPNAQSEGWQLKQPFGWKICLALLGLAMVLAVSARRTKIDKGVTLTAEGVAYSVGMTDSAEVALGWNNFFSDAFPLTFSEKTATSRIPNFDPDNLPWLAYITSEPTKTWDFEKQAWVVTGEQEFLVEPYGYLTFVMWKMLETFEMAIWGTILAVMLAIPLAYFGARGYSWNLATYGAARALCSFSRALPELIIAIFFVLMYGFGTIPGVLALGLHCCGFLGKFFADDIENVDRGPQDALRCTGAGKVKVLWYAVLPQTMPQFLAYIQYILERNVRTAAIIGIVGAGGIGQELKGRLDLSDYSHVSTIVLVIFLTILALEQITQRLRSKLIGD